MCFGSSPFCAPLHWQFIRMAPQYPKSNLHICRQSCLLVNNKILITFSRVQISQTIMHLLLLPTGLLSALALLMMPSRIEAIQCYSGNQFSIIECPSLYCIKQTLGLDTVSITSLYDDSVIRQVRYCDGTGVSSICSTYRILDTCQNVPNLVHEFMEF